MVEYVSPFWVMVQHTTMVRYKLHKISSMIEVRKLVEFSPSPNQVLGIRLYLVFS